MLKLSGFWRNRNEEIAAIDLGSNSFHMIIAKVTDGQITIVDRLKESVRLGYGLDDDGNLDDLSQKRALDCLERFNQRIKHLPANCVRAVGTRTLRQANNVYNFLAKAEQALGFDIQVIAGTEEARLVYQGVAFGIELDEQIRLVIDIGGGSTELILGESFVPFSLQSLGMGCVSITKRFFNNGLIKRANVSAANIFCLQKLEPIQNKFRRVQWQSAIGCSGSIRSVSKILETLNGHPAITLEGVEDLVSQCINMGSIEALSIPGLSEDRREVFVGGLIVLRACMIALKLETIEASPWALREGVLFDLIGNDSLSDMRERSVKQLADRFHIDQTHADSCNKVAQKLLEQIHSELSSNLAWERYLEWACLLQEVGLDINHDRFHLHSGYIVENSHLAGFGFDEQNFLAYLVRNQRKKPDWSLTEKLPAEVQNDFILVMHIFRLACVLTRARNPTQDIGWALSLKKNKLRFSAPTAWWESQQLATADLLLERSYFKKSPYQLELNNPEPEE